jgi:hypothetical protein
VAASKALAPASARAWELGDLVLEPLPEVAGEVLERGFRPGDGGRIDSAQAAAADLQAQGVVRGDALAHRIGLLPYGVGD